MTEVRGGPAIEVRGLGKRYGRVEALRGLDLEVPRGSVFGFLGPHGAPKTTLMRVLIGITLPTEGTPRVLGFDVESDSLDARRRVGYLAQLAPVLWRAHPRQTLRFARGFFPPSPDGRVDEAIDLVGLGDKVDDAVGMLSGGQRQRLGIAQACVHRPQLLILDEPAAALDPIGRRDVLAIKRRLRGETTVFCSTHILDDDVRIRAVRRQRFDLEDVLVDLVDGGGA
jgi:ABC-2 type transport system ATP-binding protein